MRRGGGAGRFRSMAMPSPPTPGAAPATPPAAPAPPIRLAHDGLRFSLDANTVDPAIIRAEQIAEYQQLELEGHVQKSKEFAAGLIVELNANNPNRVDVLWPGILIDRLDIFALLAQFRNS